MLHDPQRENRGQIIVGTYIDAITSICNITRSCASGSVSRLEPRFTAKDLLQNNHGKKMISHKASLKIKEMSYVTSSMFCRHLI